MKKEYRRRSLKFKLFFILIIIAFVFDIVMTGVSYYIYTNNITNEGMRMCSGISQTVASGVTPKVISSYITGTQGEDYVLAEEKLANIGQSFHDVESINIYATTPVGVHRVFSVGSSVGNDIQQGEVIPYTEIGSVGSLIENGENIAPVFDNENITSYSQIKDTSGKTVGYAACTLSIRHQLENRKGFITKLFFIIGMVTVLIVVMACFYMCRILISPISKMEAKIRAFAIDNSLGEETLEKLIKIKPRNILEVNMLKESFADLIGDVSIKQTELADFDKDIIDRMMSVIDPKELEVKE